MIRPASSLAVILSLSVSGIFARPADRPFELWPPVNGAAPVTYEKPAPLFDSRGKPWDIPAGFPVSVTVDVTKVLRRVNPYILGMNVMVWTGKDWFLDPVRIEMARQAGLKFWRFPGGSFSNTYHWDGDYGGRTVNNEGRDPSTGSQPNFIQTDDFIKFCRAVGAEAIVTVNYGAARYENVEKAADLAARWVKYFNVKKKFKVRYWEIGNECYGPWEDGYRVEGQPPMSGEIYGRDFAVFDKAMRRVDPDIFLGAVGVRYDNGNQWDGYTWWMRDMLPLVEGYADFVIQHNYFGKWPFQGDQYNPNSDEALWRDLSAVADIRGQNDAMVEKYTKSKTRLPVAFTEFNLVMAPTQSIQLFNGLYEACALGEQMKEGYEAGNFWAWQNGYEMKTGGDNGLLSTRDPEMPDGTPRPAYYTYAMFHRAFGDKMVSATCSAGIVKVYASTFRDGEVGLVLVNPGDRAIAVSVDLKGFKPRGRTMGWVMHGRDLHDKRVAWNGVWGPEAGGGPFPLDTIPAYTVTFAPGKAPVVKIPPLSLAGVVFY